MRTAAVLYATGFRVSAVAAASSSALSKNLMRGYVTTSGIVRAKIVEVVPALGESITEGSIAKWSKNVGDRVNVDDVVVIVETDKVTVDIKSTNAGVLTAQLATDTVRWGDLSLSFSVARVHFPFRDPCSRLFCSRAGHRWAPTLRAGHGWGGDSNLGTSSGTGSGISSSTSRGTGSTTTDGCSHVVPWADASHQVFGETVASQQGHRK